MSTVDEAVRAAGKYAGDDSLTAYEPDIYRGWVMEGILWVCRQTPVPGLHALVERETALALAEGATVLTEQPAGIQQVLAAYRDDVPCDIYLRPQDFEVMSSGELPTMTPTAARPAIFYFDVGTIRVLPAGETGGSTVTLTFIGVPDLGFDEDMPIPDYLVPAAALYAASRSLSGGESEDIGLAASKIDEALKILGVQTKET